MKASAMVAVVAVLSACAEQVTEPALQEAAFERDPSAVEAALYPVAQVMDHQRALGLTDVQAGAIRAELQRAQAELVDAEWELRREREGLADLLGGERVDEAAALAAAGRVAEREGALKLVHLRLLVRIKNQLTPDQQRALDALR